MTDENAEKFLRLLDEARAHYRQAQEFEEIAREHWQLYRDLQQQAAELAAPFKKGDIIVYETKFGYRNKRVNRVIKVGRMAVEGDCVRVSGTMCNAKGELSSGRRHVQLSAFFGGNSVDVFVKVLKSA